VKTTLWDGFSTFFDQNTTCSTLGSPQYLSNLSMSRNWAKHRKQRIFHRLKESGEFPISDNVRGFSHHIFGEFYLSLSSILDFTSARILSADFLSPPGLNFILDFTCPLMKSVKSAASMKKHYSFILPSFSNLKKRREKKLTKIYLKNTVQQYGKNSQIVSSRFPPSPPIYYFRKLTFVLETAIILTYQYSNTTKSLK
jgi:hypothetical protein